MMFAWIYLPQRCIYVAMSIYVCREQSFPHVKLLMCVVSKTLKTAIDYTNSTECNDYWLTVYTTVLFLLLCCLFSTSM